MARLDATFPNKFPEEELDYLVDWSPALESSETIVSQTVYASAGGLTADRVSQADGGVTFWLTGGTPGYGRMVCEIVTSLGRTFEVAIPILILKP